MNFLQYLKEWILEITLIVAIVFSNFLKLLKDKTTSTKKDKIIKFINGSFFGLVLGLTCFLIISTYSTNAAVSFLIGFIVGNVATHIIDIIDSKLEDIINDFIEYFSNKFK